MIKKTYSSSADFVLTFDLLFKNHDGKKIKIPVAPISGVLLIPSTITKSEQVVFALASFEVPESAKINLSLNETNNMIYLPRIIMFTSGYDLQITLSIAWQKISALTFTAEKNQSFSIKKLGIVGEKSPLGNLYQIVFSRDTRLLITFKSPNEIFSV